MVVTVTSTYSRGREGGRERERERERERGILFEGKRHGVSRSPRTRSVEDKEEVESKQDESAD